jgi:hypothetical protein
MKVRRLRALAEMLEVLNPKQFDMTTYGNLPTPHHADFIGCAAGHAVKLFAIRGLTFKSTDLPLDYTVYHTESCERGVRACMEFFELSFNQALYVFSPFQYDVFHQGSAIPPKRVAKRLMYLIDNPQYNPLSATMLEH